MRKSLLSLLGILMGFSAYAADTVLWSGEVELDWSANPSIPASKCSNFEAGGEIVVDIVCLKKDSWNSMKVSFPDWSLFSWGDATNVPTSTTVKSYTLAESDITKVRSNGFMLCGHDIKVTKVSYRPSSGPIDPSVLQKDPVTIDEASASLEFSYDAVIKAGGVVGGGILVDYKGLTDKEFYINFLHQGDADNQYVWAEFTNPQIIEEEGKSYLVLNKETLDEIGSYSKNLIVQIGYATVNQVKVIAPEDMPEAPDVAIVTLDKEKITLEVGGTDKITATIKPATAVAKWTTSDPAVATVDNEGNVTAVGGGKATITCEIEGAKATCEVSVVMIKVQWLENISGQPIYGDEENITCYIGDSPRLIITTIPEDAAITLSATQDPEKCATFYDYAKSKEAQVSFDEGKTGKVDITIKLKGIELSKSISVTAIDYPEMCLRLNTSLSGNPNYRNILAGTDFKMEASVRGPGYDRYDDTMDKPYTKQAYTWTVSDPEVAMIKEQKDATSSYSAYSTAVIVGLKTGTVTVTASVTSADGTSTITGKHELTFSGHGELSHQFYFQNDRGGSWMGKYGISNVPGNDVINDITLHGSGVDMILNSATTVSYIPRFTAGQSFTFKVSDPNVRIMSIGASPVSSATALVTFGDKTTCTTGTNDKTSWSADDEYGVEEVTFTVLDDKEVSGLIYWTPKMYRYATPELVLSDTELDGTAGESKQLTLDVANKDTEKVLPATTVWTSADPAIAKVDADGLVTYVSKGSTEITADYNGTKAVCKVNVLGQTAIESIGTDAANAPAEYFNLQGIRVDASALTPGVYIVRKGNEINKVVIK